MKKLLSAISLILFGIPANAELASVYACQYTRSSGFYFEEGQWNSVSFVVREPFFLKTDGEKITSVGDLAPEFMSCTISNIYRYHQCGDQFGNTVFFNPGNLRGGASYLNGATSDSEDHRDDVFVEMFICEAM
ncbi:hypothetical protein RUESEDTHA_00856 [Ruegeria sp. THAF57]|uniref:hypothetical protein n=1 Tax=Ruegeria sp. THAF57 TaxID=2744555 RepID=UPI0015DED22F|nr:hypothetical protein [Ruegeria sp. THAF57]CAD0183979.1 hypothetical protein RUESEDTHA_00856 [Ruegeria sp. THAF57]